MTTPQSIDARRRTLRPWHLAAILLATLAFTLFAWTNVARAAVNVTVVATGGDAVSADTAANAGDTFTLLTGPILAEESAGQFDGPYVLNAPMGFQFNINQQVTVSPSGVAGACDNLNLTAGQGAAVNVTPTPTTISVNVTNVSSGSDQCQLTYSNVQVQPIAGAGLPSGNLAFSGNARGNAGALATVAGAYDAASSTVSASTPSVVYGSMTTVVLSARDQHDNLIDDLVVGNVSFALAGGTSTGSFAIATNYGFGDYAADSTATAAGTASTLTATYAAGTNAALGGSPTITVMPKALTVTAATQTREYTGTTASSGTPTVTPGSLVGDDTIAAITQTFDNRNVGSNKVLTPAGVVTDGNGGNNYNLTLATVATGQITAHAITVTAQTDTKVYSGTVASAVTPEVTGGAVQTGDTAAFIQNFNLTGAGTDKLIFPSGVVTDGNGGANYTYTFVDDNTGVITPRPVTAPGVSAVNKVYDSTTTATLDVSDPGLTAIEWWDTVSIDADSYTATFASANVGSGVAVTVTGLGLQGSAAGNYTLTQPTGLTANITPATLTVTGVTASDKVYDGNTTATLNVGSAEFEGVLGDDSVDVGGTATGTFANNDVGTNKTVTMAGITAGGVDGGNYTVTQATTTANIMAVVQTPSEPTATPVPTPVASADPSGPVVTRTNEDSTLATAGQPTVAETQSSNGGTAEATAPANALPAGATLTAASIDNLEDLAAQAPPSADAQLVLAFAIEATDAQGNALTEDFAQPIALEFNVPADSLPAGATAGEIVLAFWNGTSWTEVQGTVLFNADGTVTVRASVDHFTIFSVQYQPGRGSFSPAPAFLVSFTVWGGGGYDLLDTAVGAGGSAWVMVDGRFHGYNVGAPAFVNAAFRTMLPAGIASNTAVVASRPTTE